MKRSTQRLRQPLIGGTAIILTMISVSGQAGFTPVGDDAQTNGPINNAPTLTDTFRQGTPVLLNETDPPGDPVSDLSDVYADVDGDLLAGAAVTTNNAMVTQGAWQYSTNNGASWVAVPTAGLSDNNALLLSASWRVRFVPAMDYTGAAGTLAGRVWDGTGTQTFGPGQVLMVSDIGGSGGYSTQILDVTVTTINDLLFRDGFE